jgi:hypothetical protein
MTFDQWIELLAVGSIVVLPAVAITVRIALKPIVEAVVRLAQATTGSGGLPPRDDNPAMGRMQEELAELQRKVADLEAAESFHQHLLKSASLPNRPSKGS